MVAEVAAVDGVEVVAVDEEVLVVVAPRIEATNCCHHRRRVWIMTLSTTMTRVAVITRYHQPLSSVVELVEGEVEVVVVAEAVANNSDIHMNLGIELHPPKTRNAFAMSLINSLSVMSKCFSSMYAIGGRERITTGWFGSLT